MCVLLIYEGKNPALPFHRPSTLLPSTLFPFVDKKAGPEDRGPLEASAFKKFYYLYINNKIFLGRS